MPTIYDVAKRARVSTYTVSAVLNRSTRVSEELTERVLRAAKLRVPRDIEVMCSDDSDWLDVFEPRISVVLQPGHEMGERAARLLFARALPIRSGLSKRWCCGPS